MKALLAATAAAALLTAAAAPPANAYWLWQNHHRVWVQPRHYDRYWRQPQRYWHETHRHVYGDYR